MLARSWLMALQVGALLCACVAACGEEAAPPETIEAAPEPEPEPEPEPVFTEHVIEMGQTLWDIARAYGVSVEEIMEANEMRQRDVRRLRAGMTILIPGEHEAVEVTRQQAVRIEDLPPLEDAAYHLLAPGETLWDVALTYEVSADTLIERNELDDDALRSLREGRPIIVPGIAQSDVRQADAGERRGFRHQVRDGETIWDLSRAFRVSVASLMAANGFDQESASNLREGQEIWVPASTQQRTAEGAPRLTRAQQQAQRRAARMGLGTTHAARELLAGRVERRWMAAAGGVNRLPGTLQWPVRNGRFVRGYGSGEGGYHLAVDIAGDIGWNVRAAARGIVAYAGDQIRGYGNIVILVHPGGWVTLYAHNSMLFVVAGQEVPAGGVIAELGSTGISRGPHVHFELMHHNKNCDPATLFRPGVRHRSRLARIPQQTWTDPDDRPSEIQCAPRRRHPNSRWVIHE